MITFCFMVICIAAVIKAEKDSKVNIDVSPLIFTGFMDMVIVYLIVSALT